MDATHERATALSDLMTAHARLCRVVAASMAISSDEQSVLLTLAERGYMLDELAAATGFPEAQASAVVESLVASGRVRHVTRDVDARVLVVLTKLGMQPVLAHAELIDELAAVPASAEDDVVAFLERAAAGARVQADVLEHAS